MNIRYKHFAIGHKFYLTAILILISTIAVPTVVAQEEYVVVIKAGTIYPVTAPPIQDSMILIRDGKIEAIGKDLKIPENAEVIDATSKTVIPGLIDAFTTLAERGR
ncbi:MAG: hypothetical protein ACYS6K_09290, partial [Planctomycetota bacterium]